MTFDPRGVGDSDGVDCPAAAQDYYEALALDVAPSRIADFVRACIAEAGVPEDDLRQYAGSQVVGDLEAIRNDLGVERLVIHGESYGTTVAQRYAMTHPDRVAALILDAPLDVTDDGDAQWAEATVGFDTTLDRTLSWCRDDPECSDAMNAPAASWKRMMATIERGDVVARYAASDGRVYDFDIDRAGALDAVSSAMYTESGRGLVLRALAAADRGDWVPLGRMVRGRFKTTSTIESSDFTYYASWCADRAETDAPFDPAGYIAWAADLPTSAGRMGDVVLSGAACSAWPVETAPSSPATLGLPAGIPVVILTATADPITPSYIGDRLARRWSATSDVYRIETSDGPHVTFGRGDPCVDGPVVALLVDEVRPPDRTECEGVLVDGFWDVLRVDALGDDLIARADVFHDELINHPDYVTWNGVDPLALGCRHGGTIDVEANGSVTDVAAKGCQIVPGETIHGTGAIDDDGVRYDLRFPGGAWEYRLDVDGSGFIKGEFDGKPVLETW